MKNEALEHFQAVCELAFRFLVDEFSFLPVPLPEGEFINEFQFRLSNGQLTLVVEGINYGLNAMVSLEDTHGRSIGTGCLLPDWEPFAKRKWKRHKGELGVANQDHQIKEAAQQLRTYGQDILAGDLRRFNEIGDRINFIRSRFRENRLHQAS